MDSARLWEMQSSKSFNFIRRYGLAFSVGSSRMFCNSCVRRLCSGRFASFRAFRGALPRGFCLLRIPSSRKETKNDWVTVSSLIEALGVYYSESPEGARQLESARLLFRRLRSCAFAGDCASIGERALTRSIYLSPWKAPAENHRGDFVKFGDGVRKSWSWCRGKHSIAREDHKFIP